MREEKIENKLNQDLKFKCLEILLHAQDNKTNTDLSCPYHTWMGEDLNHCPGIGEWKCKLQEYWYASDQYGLDSKDYRNCNIKNHKDCKLYINSMTK